MTMILKHEAQISAGDVELMAIDYTEWLDDGELLTGTPIAVEQTTSDLTISYVAVSTSAQTILESSVSAGAAVQFLVSGQQAGITYRVLVTASTDATPARTAERIAQIRVV